MGRQHNKKEPENGQKYEASTSYLFLTHFCIVFTYKNQGEDGVVRRVGWDSVLRTTEKAILDGNAIKSERDGGTGGGRRGHFRCEGGFRWLS